MVELNVFILLLEKIFFKIWILHNQKWIQLQKASEKYSNKVYKNQRRYFQKLY